MDSAAKNPGKSDASPQSGGFDARFGVAGEGTPKALARLAGIFALGVAAAVAGRLIHLPLPFVLGPLFVTACLGFSGLPVAGIRKVRPAAQFVIGAAIGCQFTGAVLLKLAGLLPLILGSALLSILVCAGAAVLLILTAGLDRKTAFFATSPAGAAEMANIAARYGGEAEPIMVAQTMRVVLTVLAAPFLVIHFANDGAFHPVTATAVMSVPSFATLVASAAVGGVLMARTGYPNGWFMGPLIACAIAGSFGLIEGRVPDIIINVCQVLIGCSLGAQFRREFLTRLFGMMAAATLSIVVVLTIMAISAIACAYAFHLPVAAMALAFAPAGMAEMTLTGKVLGLDATLISGFHSVRIIMVMAMVVPAFRLFDRIFVGVFSRNDV